MGSRRGPNELFSAAGRRPSRLASMAHGADNDSYGPPLTADVCGRASARPRTTNSRAGSRGVVERPRRLRGRGAPRWSPPPPRPAPDEARARPRRISAQRPNVEARRGRRFERFHSPRRGGRPPGASCGCAAGAGRTLWIAELLTMEIRLLWQECSDILLYISSSFATLAYLLSKLP